MTMTEPAMRRWELLAGEIESACDDLHSIEQEGRRVAKDIRRKVKRLKTKMSHVQKAKP